MLDKIIELSGADIRVETDPEKLRPVDVPFIEPDISKLKRDTGWEKRIPLEASLAEILHHFKTEK